MKKVLVTGGKGFIGSHLVDSLVENFEVFVIDNGLSGNNVNPDATYYDADIRSLKSIFGHFKDIDYVFHMAAIPRTVWCIDDPVLCYETNVLGSLNVLEAAFKNNVKRVILTSSNIVYAADTPYKASKIAMEEISKVYTSLYGISTICLRNSNVYGSRQREDGIGPNCFASIKKSIKENGYIEITGDGEQTRDFTHVSDIVRANILAMDSDVVGNIDLCTGRNVSLNYVASLFKAPIKYVSERRGDIKHIIQKNAESENLLNWKTKVALEEGIGDVM
ncbi:MAG: NAD-dependent epimerase/dehydratase family protein [Candidatus Paceibacterota bacterium]|jgi:UDP-glucose 4-epimerase